MLSVVVNIGLWLLGLCGFGKPDPEKTGEQVMAGKEAQQVLNEVAQEKRADSEPVPDSVVRESYRD